MAHVHVLSNLTSSLPQRATGTHRRKLTLSTLARRHGLDPRRQPLVCSRNGQWISQRQWRRVCARRDDVVVFVVMSRGDSVRTIAMLGILIAAAVAAPYLLGPVGLGIIGAGSGAIFAAGSVGAGALTAITTAGLVIGGNYLLNVLIPTKPAGDLSSPHVQDTSPTYAKTISAQNNIARLGAPIPVLYGRMRFVPDLASSPWVEWIDNVQHLRQLFVLTQGVLEIEKIELGQTDISSFADVQIQVIDQGSFVTLFFPEVYTSNQVSNADLTAPNDPAISSGLLDRAEFNFSVPYALNDYVWIIQTAGEPRQYWKSLQNSNTGHIPYDFPGTFWDLIGNQPPGGTVIKGPFAVCPPGTTCDLIGLDFSFPAGLYALNPTTGNPDPGALNVTIEYQQIDDNGNALTDWAALAGFIADSTTSTLITATGATFMGGGYQYESQRTSPITVSIRITMPSRQRWQVRAYRTTGKTLTGTLGQDIAWVGLRGYLASTRSYGAFTMLAVDIAASATSSVNEQSARQVAVTGTRKTSVWHGSFGALEANRAIAWAVADILKDPTYGGNLSDSQFDLDALLTLHTTWELRGDKFDYYAASTTTLWAALGLALRAGRTVAYHQSGIVRFHRDAAQIVPRMLFSNENIIKGSFQMNFLLPSPEDETDSIEVDFLDETNWLQGTVTLPKSGVVDPVSPSINQFDGVVQEAQATREAEYLLAADQYRRILISFDTELEGLIASRGDLILIHHDMPKWGQSTRIYDYDGPTLTFTLWSRLDFSEAGTWYAYFRAPNGAVSNPIQILSYDDDAMTITLAASPGVDISTSRAEPTHVVVGRSTEIPRQAIFLGATPRGGKAVSITAVLEDSRVHVN